jgi:hypothetical protein
MEIGDIMNVLFVGAHPDDIECGGGTATLYAQQGHKPDEKGKHLDVEVERHPGHESGDRNK